GARGPGAAAAGRGGGGGAAVGGGGAGRRGGVKSPRAKPPGGVRRAPASIHRARAAIDASGQVIAYEFTSKGFSRLDVNTNGGAPWDTLAGAFPSFSPPVGGALGGPARNPQCPKKTLGWRTGGRAVRPAAP